MDWFNSHSSICPHQEDFFGYLNVQKICTEEPSSHHFLLCHISYLTIIKALSVVVFKAVLASAKKSDPASQDVEWGCKYGHAMELYTFQGLLSTLDDMMKRSARWSYKAQGQSEASKGTIWSHIRFRVCFLPCRNAE